MKRRWKRNQKKMERNEETRRNIKRTFRTKKQQHAQRQGYLPIVCQNSTWQLRALAKLEECISNFMPVRMSFHVPFQFSCHLSLLLKFNVSFISHVMSSGVVHGIFHVSSNFIVHSIPHVISQFTSHVRSHFVSLFISHVISHFMSHDISQFIYHFIPHGIHQHMSHVIHQLMSHVISHCIPHFFSYAISHEGCSWYVSCHLFYFISDFISHVILHGISHVMSHFMSNFIYDSHPQFIYHVKSHSISHFKCQFISCLTGDVISHLISHYIAWFIWFPCNFSYHVVFHVPCHFSCHVSCHLLFHLSIMSCLIWHPSHFSFFSHVVSVVSHFTSHVIYHFISHLVSHVISHFTETNGWNSSVRNQLTRKLNPWIGMAKVLAQGLTKQFPKGPEKFTKLEDNSHPKHLRLQVLLTLFKRGFIELSHEGFKVLSPQLQLAKDQAERFRWS